MNKKTTGKKRWHKQRLDELTMDENFLYSAVGAWLYTSDWLIMDMIAGLQMFLHERFRGYKIERLMVKLQAVAGSKLSLVAICKPGALLHHVLV